MAKIKCDRKNCKRSANWNMQTGRNFYSIVDNSYLQHHFEDDGQENVTLCDYHAQKESYI